MLQDPNEDVNNEQKGFYIAFDNDQPKRPKPPLRTKRSPKKERSVDDTSSSGGGGGSSSVGNNNKHEQISQLERELNNEQNQMSGK